MADGRLSQAAIEILSQPAAAARVSHAPVELLSRPDAAARVSHVVIEILASTLVVVPPAVAGAQIYVWGPL